MLEQSFNIIRYESNTLNCLLIGLNMEQMKKQFETLKYRAQYYSSLVKNTNLESALD